MPSNNTLRKRWTFRFCQITKKIMKLLLNQSRRHDFYYFLVIIWPMLVIQIFQDENALVNIGSTIITASSTFAILYWLTFVIFPSGQYYISLWSLTGFYLHWEYLPGSKVSYQGGLKSMPKRMIMRTAHKDVWWCGKFERHTTRFISTCPCTKLL